MILTGSRLMKEIDQERITIMPFNKAQVNPNSYDFRLGGVILTYKNYILDTRKQNEIIAHVIPDEGMLLTPGRIYLGHTEEIMGSDYYVPIIRAKSSIARLGLFIHVTADLIDIGSHNQWTLQMNPIHPIRVYRGMLLGQVTFWQVKGEIKLYKGKYQGLMGPQPSQSFKDFYQENVR